MAVAITKKDRTKLIFGIVLLLIAFALLYNALYSSPPRAPDVAAGPAAGQAGKSSALTQFQNPALLAAQRQRGAGGRHGAVANAGNIADPKLRLDLLAKVAAVKYDAGGRNVFAFYTPPPPPLPQPKQPALTGPDGKPAPPAGPPPPPPPPPIPLKFYGYAHKPGETQKKVFLIEGDQIYIAGEGDMVKKRYRINKIGVNTVEVEDTVTHNKQSLPLQETP